MFKKLDVSHDEKFIFFMTVLQVVRALMVIVIDVHIATNCFQKRFCCLAHALTSAVGTGSTGGFATLITV
jgi:hypothetical protein